MGAVAVIVPVLRRPHRAQAVADSVRQATPYARLVFVCSPEDQAEIDACNATGADVLVADRPCGHGDYAHKINLAYRATTEPWVFTGADDLKFHRGWLLKALARAGEGIGVVGTNDLGNPAVLAGEHATHSLVARWYADRHGTIDGPGAVMSEAYHHNFCDTEMVGTAKARGAWVFAADSVVEHLHPNWNADVVRDEVYTLGQSMFSVDQRVFRRRRLKWRRRTWT